MCSVSCSIVQRWSWFLFSSRDNCPVRPYWRLSSKFQISSITLTSGPHFPKTSALLFLSLSQLKVNKKQHSQPIVLLHFWILKKKNRQQVCKFTKDFWGLFPSCKKHCRVYTESWEQHKILQWLHFFFKSLTLFAIIAVTFLTLTLTTIKLLCCKSPPCHRPFVTCQLYWVNITALQERGSRHFKHSFTVSAPCVQERYLYPPNAVTEWSPLGQHSVREAC